MMEDDYESFDDDSPGGQALHVDEGDDDEFDLDLPPTTGNEYLRRVRMEANSCPKVVVANIDTKPFLHKQTVHVKHWSSSCHPAPRGFAPSLDWQNMQVANFADNRQKLARHKAKRQKLKVAKFPSLPPAMDVNAWCRLCFGRVKPPPRQGEPAEADGITGDDGNVRHEGILPLVSTVVNMDQPTVIKVLEYHLNWFEATGFSDKQGYWFYALLLCLDKPLLPDACSLIRGLARACANLRASLENSEDKRLIPMNLFICLISRYFEQRDLGDDVT